MAPAYFWHGRGQIKDNSIWHPPVPKVRGVLWGCFCVPTPDYVNSIRLPVRRGTEAMRHLECRYRNQSSNAVTKKWLRLLAEPPGAPRGRRAPAFTAFF